MWDRYFLRSLCSAACLCLALLGIAAWNVVIGDTPAAAWYALAALELFLLGGIAFILYAMLLI